MLFPHSTAPTLHVPRADFFTRFNIIIIPLILYVVFTGRTRRVLPIFEWLHTIAASTLVCLGTQLRVIQIHGKEWADFNSRILDFYFVLSLMSWVACIMMDGRHTIRICRAHGRHLMQRLGRLNRTGLLELVGLLISLLSMIVLAHDVYNSFSQLTHSQAYYYWFFVTVLSKLSRFGMQGTPITKLAA